METSTIPSSPRSRWYQDDIGNTSSLRMIVVPAAIVGILIAVSGAVAMFFDLSAAGTAMATGAGMVATAQAAKAWQKSSEVRHEEGVECG